MSADSLGPLVPLFQTSLWVALIVGTGIVLRKRIGPLLTALTKRVEGGSSFKAGPFEVGEDLQKLERVEPQPNTTQKAIPAGAIDWPAERAAIYDDTHCIFLTHVIEPSREQGQEYDIFVYLIPHKETDIAIVKYAEFFFGHYWGNEVFAETLRNGHIGVRTSAFGPFLCTCRIHFNDGRVAFVSRYIDFEMGRVFRHAI